MIKGVVRQALVVIATIAMITVNALANILPINGQNTGEISDRFEVYFTPAGYVFSIWGLIYIGLIAFTIYQALPAQRQNKTLDKVGPVYALGCAANIAWIFLWHYNVFYPTILAMVVLLITLIVNYLQLDVQGQQVSAAMKWMVHVPFSVYLGWITVATIANATSLLWLADWNGFGLSAEVWTAVVLAVAVIIAGAMAATRGDAAYLAVLVWAFVGIAVKHPDVPLVAFSAWIAAGVVAIMILYSLFATRAQPIRMPA